MIEYWDLTSTPWIHFNILSSSFFPIHIYVLIYDMWNPATKREGNVRVIYHKHIWVKFPKAVVILGNQSFRHPKRVMSHFQSYKTAFIHFLGHIACYLQQYVWLTTVCKMICFKFLAIWTQISVYEHQFSFFFFKKKGGGERNLGN